jgi:hypothetical protein
LAHNYADNQLFINPGDFIVQSNPYRRPVRPQDLDGFDFSRQLPRDQFFSASALAAQRILLNVYESELIFLPKGPLAPVEQDFRTFYADELKLAGEAIRPILEDHLFGFLDREIDVSGPWSLPAMRAYFATRLDEANRGESRVVETILAAGDKEAAATDFLIQLAADFLTEASAMARNVLGNFGAPLSELFKVLIDEYGYGVPEAKHSTLFEKTLESRELLTAIGNFTSGRRSPSSITSISSRATTPISSVIWARSITRNRPSRTPTDSRPACCSGSSPVPSIPGISRNTFTSTSIIAAWCCRRSSNRSSSAAATR